MGKANEVVDLAFVYALEGNRVELDAETGAHRGVQANHDLRQISPARDRLEAPRIECIEGNVDASNASILEFGGKLGQLAAVGRQGQLVQLAALEVAREGTEQPHDVLAH